MVELEQEEEWGLWGGLDDGCLPHLYPNHFQARLQQYLEE